MEGLRGFSMWLVFCAHLCIAFGGLFYATDVAATPLKMLPGLRLKALSWGASSNYGVDLFFLLSGFLIFRMLISRQGSFRFGQFLWQRALRIYPALLLSLVVGAWISVRLEIRNVIPEVFLENVLLLNGIFELQVPAYNPVTWSLTFEMLFYLLCPLVLLFARWGSLRSLARFLLFAFPVAIALMFLPGAYARALMFLPGCLLAMCSDEQLTDLARRIPEPLVIGVYLAATTIFALCPELRWGRWTFLFAPVGMVLVLKACFGSGVLNRACRWKGLRFFGNISYSFYLLHLLCLLVAGRSIAGCPWLPASPELRFLIVGAATLSVSLLVSVALYLVAERGYFVARHGSPWSGWQPKVIMPVSCAVALLFCVPGIRSSLRGSPSDHLPVFECTGEFPGVEIAGTARAERREGALHIESLGEDPQVILPQLTSSLDSPPVLEVDLDVPANTRMQVFYLPDRDGTYSEINSARIPLHMGKNAARLWLPASVAGTRLRIDPAEAPGSIVIRSITVWQGSR